MANIDKEVEQIIKNAIKSSEVIIKNAIDPKNEKGLLIEDIYKIECKIFKNLKDSPEDYNLENFRKLFDNDNIKLFELVKKDLEDNEINTLLKFNCTFDTLIRELKKYAGIDVNIKEKEIERRNKNIFSLEIKFSILIGIIILLDLFFYYPIVYENDKDMTKAFNDQYKKELKIIKNFNNSENALKYKTDNLFYDQAAIVSYVNIAYENETLYFKKEEVEKHGKQYVYEEAEKCLKEIIRIINKKE